MANNEHVRLVNNGKGAFNSWREAYPDECLDLRETSFNTKDLQGFNLDGADFRGTDLSRFDLLDASLVGANLTGVNLQNAELIRADLTDAILDDANLSHAHLREAKCEGASFVGAVFDATNLGAATLRSANLTGVSMKGGLMEEADLSGSTLRNAKVTATVAKSARFVGVDCTEAELDGKFGGADFSDAILVGCHIAGSWPSVTLEKADLSNATVKEGTSLGAAKAAGANFSNAQLEGVNLERAELCGTRFNGANLRKSNLRDSDLSEASIDEADLFEAELSGCQLRSLRGVVNAKNLTTVTVKPHERYFETCERQFFERWLDWEHIRGIGQLKLFAISYSLVLFLITTFYLVGHYNERIEIAREWAKQVVEHDDEHETLKDKGTTILAVQVSDKLTKVTVHRTSILLLLSTIVLVFASSVYALGCPDEIKNFTRAQWCYQLDRSLVHYWAYSWKWRKGRIIASVSYLIGGAGVVLISGWKLFFVIRYIWKYVSF